MIKYTNAILRIKTNPGYPIYKDFIFIGIALSVFFNYFGIATFYFFQIALVMIMIIMYGANKSVKELIYFIKAHALLSVSFLIWFFSTCINTGIVSSFRIVADFCIIFMGYLFVQKKGEYGLSVSLRRVVLLFLIMSIIGLVMYFTKINPFINYSEFAASYWSRVGGSRLTSFWLTPIPEASCIGVFLILAYYFYKGFSQIALLAIGLLAFLFTQTRSAWFGLLIVIFFAVIPTLTMKNRVIKKNTIIFGIFLIITLIILGFVFQSRLQNIILMIVDRLFGESLLSDMSFTWRFMAMGLIALRSIQDGIIGVLFGHGINSAALMLEGMSFGSRFSYNVATVDNSYISALYDLGITGFIWMVVCLIWTIKIYFRQKKNYMLKIISLCIFFLLIMAFFYEEIYWCNISYVLFIFIGIQIGLTHTTQRVQTKVDVKT